MIGNGDGHGDGGHGGNGTGPATGTSRREFLKLLGLGGAGAAAAACGPPDSGDKLYPYFVDPEDVTPGVNERYATALANAGPEPLSLHATVRDGRVIHLEPNPDVPGSGQGTSPLILSALQDLYDPDRIPAPRRSTGPDPEAWEELDWEGALAAAGEALSGDGVVLLTPAVAGTSDRFFGEWAEAVGAEHVRYESLGLEALREAHRIAFGRAEIPRYGLEEADFVVSFGADFLESWLAPVELSGRFSRAREVDDGRYAPLAFVGPRLSMTGTSADRWLPARSGTEARVALAAAHVVAAEATGPRAADARSFLSEFTPERAAEVSGVEAEEIRRLGESLADADAPVALPPGVAGQTARATDAHLAVAVLNWVSGAVGTTVRFGAGPTRLPSATYREMRDLADRMEAGEVRTLVVAGPNPAYTLPASSGFAGAMEGVETVISLNSHPDETTVAADLVLPSHHELESWGDVELRPGHRALRQPVMRPVFDTRQTEDILMGAASAAGIELPTDADDFGAYLQARWRELYPASGASPSFRDWWTSALQRGGLFADLDPTVPVELSGDVLGHDFAEPSGGDGMRFVAFPTGQFYDGRGANRPWMQEFPDPVTKLVWASWVELHPETAEPLGLETGDVVRLETEAGTLEAPVYLYRGIRPDTAAIPLGQGHTAYGETARDQGVNPLDLLPDVADDASGVLAYGGVDVEITATGERSRLVSLQGSDVDEGREIAEIMSLGTAREAVESHHVDLEELLEAAQDADPDSPYRWGMTVDLNACTGCGACVTACYSENNLPVVGQEEAAMGREMSWLRIERYYEETADGGFQTVHEPMLCQHCGDAPCEPVCPVYATYHNPEGLNVQVYNRCVGTRYCANNCPYKVRRFNYFTAEWPYPRNLGLNPDVTVREKGVMEKCTFCVQRINRAKMNAKEEGRLVEDGEIRTACQSACPTEAIVFGNLKDPTSRVSRIAKGARSYHVLEELNTRPAVTYLKDVTEAEMPASGGGHGGGGHAGGGEGGDHGSGDDAAHGA
jgi:molybdopterin-containing oxidoreductase family iron-sulfur binding subunit